MDKFTQKYMSEMRFYDCVEQDFFVQAIGYNDLHFIEPIKVARLQNVYTIHLVLNGRGTLHLGESTYTVNKHDLFFVPPHTSLCYYPDDDDKWDYVWFELTGENSEKYAAKLGLGVENPVMHCKDFRSSYFALYSLFKRFERSGVGYYDALSTFYKLLDINLAERHGGEPSLAEMAVTYISCHYHNPALTVESICRDLGVSHSYLCRVFKQQMGFSIVRHLIDVRIEEACRLLRESTLSIKEIAYSVGFGDDVHFMKTFKKHIGTTATVYRRTA